jgi:uncharacterized Zn finger protein (UPF0148 family)
MWRRFLFPWWRIRDDRGRRISVHWLEHADGERAHAIRHIGRELDVFRDASVGIVIAVCLLVGQALWAWWIAVGLAWISILVINFMLPVVLSPRVQRAIGRVLRHGVCGACAYPLDGVEAAGGYLTCPECGAQWRQERVLDLARTPDEVRRRGDRDTARSRLREKSESTHKTSDDRGTPVKIRFHSARRCRGLEGDYAGRLLELWRSMRWSGAWVRVLGASVFIGLGLASIPFIQMMAAWSPTGSWRWAAAGGMLFFGFLAWHVLSTSGGLNWAAFRQRAASLRVCPSCWDDLEAGLRREDGCVECAECGAAWKMSAHDSSGMDRPIERACRSAGHEGAG